MQGIVGGVTSGAVSRFSTFDFVEKAAKKKEEDVKDGPKGQEQDLRSLLEQHLRTAFKEYAARIMEYVERDSFCIECDGVFQPDDTRTCEECVVKIAEDHAKENPHG